MVELRVLPASGVVAIGALGPTLAAMYIVRLMAGDAIFGRVLVAVAEMTGSAGDLGMPVVQWKGGLVVIVVHAAPGTLLVARRTIAPELAFVRLLLAVATQAVARRLAVGLTRLMATRARHDGVRALQRVVGAIVIELLAAEFDDVGVAPEMLRVAGAAFGGFDGGEVAMVAAVLAHIRRDVFVAGEAESRLAAAVGAIVAVRAVVLVLGVRGRQLAGHEERLGVHGFSSPGRE